LLAIPVIDTTVFFAAVSQPIVNLWTIPETSEARFPRRRSWGRAWAAHLPAGGPRRLPRAIHCHCRAGSASPRL